MHKNNFLQIAMVIVAMLLIAALFLPAQAKAGSQLMYMTVSDKVIQVELEDNAASGGLAEKLSEGDLVINTSQYGSFEQVGLLGFSLEDSDERITTKPGDVLLYTGDHICFYYAENTYDFTRLGHMKDISEAEIRELLAVPSLTITLSLKNPDNKEDSNGVLVAYFSATGNTKSVAEKVASAVESRYGVSADLIEIVPEQPYTAEDLNYSDSGTRATREQNDDDARPQIAGEKIDIDDHKVIFLGYPIWWGKAPKIIYTFLESYNLTGKIIIPFCTSGSSGISGSEPGIKGLAEGAEWISGRRFSSNDSQDTVDGWIESLNIDLSNTCDDKGDSSSSGKSSSSSSIKDDDSSSGKGGSSSSGKSSSSSSVKDDDSSSDKGGSSSSIKDDSSSSNKDGSSSDPGNAAAMDRGSLTDTAGFVISGNKVYITQSGDDAIITLARGNRVYVNGDPGSYEKLKDPHISLSRKGMIRAKQETTSPVILKYRTGGADKTLCVNVIDPALKYMGAKRLKASVNNGEYFDMMIKAPVNLVFLTAKNKGVIGDLQTMMDADGVWHIIGTAQKTGSAFIPFSVNGKKFSAKIKVKKSADKGNTGDKKRALVVYFSATGTTRTVAQNISKTINEQYNVPTDIFEIVPKVSYTAEDLNYNDKNSRATVEQNNPSARPEMLKNIEKIRDYDLVLIGYPIWWGKAPRIICTFLEANDLSDITVAPFCTSGSSGIGGSEKELHQIEDKAKWEDGKRFTANPGQEDIMRWLNGMR